MMSEDEAKTKRCCGPDGCGKEAGTMQFIDATSAPRLLISERVCIGSACMAWRWDMTWASSTEEGHGGDLVLRLKRLQGEPKRGFCGLAGRPE